MLVTFGYPASRRGSADASAPCVESMRVPLTSAVMPGRMLMLSGSMETMEPVVLMLTFSTSPLPVTGTPVSRFSVFTVALGSSVRDAPAAVSSTVSFWSVPAATRSVESGVLLTTFSRLPDREKFAPRGPSRLMLSSPRPVGVRSRMYAPERTDVFLMEVVPSARRDRYCPLRLSTSRLFASTLRRITLSSPVSLSPDPATMMSPSTRTFSSVTAPSSKPPLTYRFPAIVVLRNVVAALEIVTLPNTSPNSYVPGSCMRLPKARSSSRAMAPREMFASGRNVPSG